MEPQFGDGSLHDAYPSLGHTKELLGKSIWAVFQLTT